MFIKNCFKISSTFFFLLSTVLSPASSELSLDMGSSSAAPILEKIKFFYRVNIKNLTHSSDAEIKKIIEELFISSGANTADPLTLESIRDTLQDMTLDESDAAEEKHSSHNPTRVKADKIFLNLIEEHLLIKRRSLSPRRDPRGAPIHSDSGSLKTITINESVPWQKLDSSTQKSCQYYSIFNALCAVAQREKIKEPGLTYDNDAKFKELKSLWSDLMVKSAPFHKVLVDATFLCQGETLTKESCLEEPHDPGTNFIIEAVCNGQGGVSNELGKALQKHIAVITTRPYITKLFDNRTFETLPEMYLGALTRSTKEGWIKRFNFIEKTTPVSLENFRGKSIDYLIVITCPKLAEGHAFLIVFDRIKGTSDVTAQVLDSELYSPGKSTRPTVKTIYYELLDNQDLSRKIELLKGPESSTESATSSAK